MIFAIMFNVSLALPVSHNGFLLELAGSKEAIFIHARRFGGAYSSLTAKGGGLPLFNYNACNYSDALPVTIRFANKVGEVLTMGSAKDSEKQPLKFYI